MRGIIDSGQKIITNGLVFRFDAAQLRSYPGSGTDVFDLSGGNRTAVLQNGVGFSTVNGGSFTTDGSNDRIQGPAWNSILSTASGPATIDYWCKFNSNGSVYVDSWIWGNLWYENDEGLNSRLVLNTSGGLRGQGIGIGPGDYAIYNVVWQIERIGTNLYCWGYKNGELYSYQDLGNLTVTQGSQTWNLGEQRNSNIYSAKVYNRVLSAAEIKQNYDADKSRFGLT